MSISCNMLCRPAGPQQDSDELFSNEDLRLYSAWPHDDSGRICSDLSCFLRGQPAIDTLGIQHHSNRTSGVTSASDTFHEGLGPTARSHQHVNAAKAVKSASAKAAQTQLQASHEISSQDAVAAHVAATATASVLLPPVESRNTSLDHALNKQTPAGLGKLAARASPPIEQRNALDKHPAGHRSTVACPAPQQQDQAAATASDLAHERTQLSAKSPERLAQPEAGLHLGTCIDPGQDAWPLGQQNSGHLSPLTLADDHCKSPQAGVAAQRDPSAMTSPPAEQQHIARDINSPKFQLSPAIAAAMNPNNPAFDPAIRDSWKAAMAYQRLAARGKGKGQGSRRGRPQKHSNLSRQDHAFFLENAGMLSDSSQELAQA